MFSNLRSELFVSRAAIVADMTCQRTLPYVADLICNGVYDIDQYNKLTAHKQLSFNKKAGMDAKDPSVLL